MIEDRQREMLRKVWPEKYPFPDDAAIEAAVAKWHEECERDRANGYDGDFCFDFGFAMSSYTPCLWLHLFGIKVASPFAVSPA